MQTVPGRSYAQVMSAWKAFLQAGSLFAEMQTVASGNCSAARTAAPDDDPEMQTAVSGSCSASKPAVPDDVPAA